MNRTFPHHHDHALKPEICFLTWPSWSIPSMFNLVKCLISSTFPVRSIWTPSIKLASTHCFFTTYLLTGLFPMEYTSSTVNEETINNRELNWRRRWLWVNISSIREFWSSSMSSKRKIHGWVDSVFELFAIFKNSKLSLIVPETEKNYCLTSYVHPVNQFISISM